MTIMQVWAVLFAFVGIQMAWNLQPFVGDREQPFKLFRHYEGSFYTGVIYSLQKLSQGEGERRAPAAVRRTPGDLPEHYLPLTLPPFDSTQAGRP